MQQKIFASFAGNLDELSFNLYSSLAISFSSEEILNKQINVQVKAMVSFSLFLGIKSIGSCIQTFGCF